MAANFNGNKSEKDSVKHYFNLGYKYSTILNLLERNHDICMSMRTFKRRLEDFELKKRNVDIDYEHVRALIQEIIVGPGSMWGYRSIWHALRLKYKIHVPCSLVAQIVREIDPEGVNLHRQHRFSRR